MNRSFRTEAVKSVFTPCAKYAKDFALVLISFICVNPGLFAQALQIKKEVAFGSITPDLGNHRLIINSSGDVVTSSKFLMDSSNNTRWQISRFNKQLAPLTEHVTSLSSRKLDLITFIQAVDKSYLFLGSAEVRKVRQYNTDFGTTNSLLT